MFNIFVQACGTALVVGFGAVMLAAVPPTSTCRGVLQAAAAGYVIYMVISWILWIGPSRLVSPDAVTYDRIASEVANWWSGASASQPTVPSGKELFIYILAVLYLLFGHAPLAGLAINSLMFSWVILLVGDATAKLAGHRAATVASRLVLLHPAMLIWGTQLIREPAAWLCIAALLNVGVRIIIGGLTRRRCVAVLLAGSLFVPTRATIAVFVLAAFIFSLVVLGSDRLVRGSTRLRGIGMMLVCAALVVFLAPRFGDLNVFSQLDPSSIVNRHNELRTTARTGFGGEVDPSSSYGGILSQLPTALAMVLFGPFPWQFPSTPVFADADALAWWITCGMAVAGWRHIGRPRWLFLVMAMTMTIIMAGTLANIGIVIRMRAQLVVLVIPLAAVGFTRARGQAGATRRRGYLEHQSRRPAVGLRRAGVT